MALYEPVIPARYAAPLLDLVRECAPDLLAAILATANLTQRATTDVAGALTITQFDALLTAAGTALGRSDLGFILGHRIDIDTHGALGVVLRQCGNLETMLRTCERYWRLITPTFSARYLRGSQFGEWRIRVTAPMSPSTLHHMLELHAVSCHLDLHRLLGVKAGIEIDIAMLPPRHQLRYARLHHTKFRFIPGGLPEVRCKVPHALLEKSFEPAQAVGEADGISSLAGALSAFRPARKCADWIGMILREAHGVQPTLADFADLLNVSPRTLTRYLTAEGCDLRELGLTVRHERACSLLRRTHLPIALIAADLGYSDVTAFTRAFRRISGTPPLVFRKGEVATEHKQVTARSRLWSNQWQD